MALSPASDEHFLKADKSVVTAARMAWTRRNEATAMCRLGVTSGGATVGEAVLLVSLVVPRDWKFKLLRRGDEVVRWDLTAPPARHSNPPGRPPGFPGKVTALEHEHRWIQGLGMSCAMPLNLSSSSSGNHRQALAAFCDRANIRFDAIYQPPPPPGEQLQLG